MHLNQMHHHAMQHAQNQAMNQALRAQQWSTRAQLETQLQTPERTSQADMGNMAMNFCMLVQVVIEKLLIGRRS